MTRRQTYTAPPASHYYGARPPFDPYAPDQPITYHAPEPMMGWDTPSPLGAVIVTALSAGVVGFALGMILVASFAGVWFK